MKPPKFINNRDNLVIDELYESIRPGSKLSVMSAYFTLYAFEALQKELETVEEFRFIYNEPTFVEQKREMREFYIQKNNNVFGTEFEIKLRNEMEQTAIAKECADWIRKKARFKSFDKNNPGSSKMMHISNGTEDVVLSGSDFSSDGLGITPSNRIEQVMALYDSANTKSFLQSFEEVWNNPAMVQDVTTEVMESMEILYQENPPEFIYFIALYNIFFDYLGELSEDTIKEKTGFKETKIWEML